MAWRVLEAAESANGGQLLMRDPKETAIAANSCFISLGSVPVRPNGVPATLPGIIYLGFSTGPSNR